jgi:thiamine pyrophosphate-dependent acetolactate synthase large subunit-like protein
MLVLCGDVPNAKNSHVQYIDQERLISATGAGYQQIASNSIEVDVKTAIERSNSEQRPIVVSIPLDLQISDIDFSLDVSVAAARAPRKSIDVDPSALDVAVGIIASSHRPIVLAGVGAVRSGARAELVRLATKIGAALATTVMAKDYFLGETGDLGIFGTFATSKELELMLSSDCVIAFGASLNIFTTAEGSLVAGKSVVHCDQNIEAIGRWTDATIGIVGDAKDVATQINNWLDELQQEPSDFRGEVGKSLEDQPHWDDYSDQVGDGTVDMRTFLIKLDQILPKTRRVAVDSGHFLAAPVRYLKVESPLNWIWTTSFGSIGLGMAAAIGAACADDGVPTIAVIGDGGFMMSLSEFNTAVRYGMDLVVVVLNDGSYGAEYHTLRKAGLEVDISLFEWPDFAELGASLGGRSLTIRNMDSDIAALETAMHLRNGPLLVDVRLDPSVIIGFHD